MFDFRYHALSLVAVFLALGIGILLGVTIGDSLVSEAEQSVRSGLRGDLVDARDTAESLREENAQLEEVIERAFPLLVGDRLEGRRVAIVAFGSLPDDIDGPVAEAIEAAGGEVDSRSVLEVPVDERGLREAIGGRFERLAGNEDLRTLGVRIGRSIGAGGQIAARLERQLDELFKGDYEGADAIVLYRASQEDLPDASAAFQRAAVDGLERTDVPLVGVERSDTDPSQVGFFRRHELSSVDHVDTATGRVALAFALAGARGTFGFKGSAEEALPEPAPAGEGAGGGAG